MSYLAKLGDIAERYNEYTGERYIYSLGMIKHSGYDEEYIIYMRRADSEEPTESIISLWSAEAHKLRELLNS